METALGMVGDAMAVLATSRLPSTVIANAIFLIIFSKPADTVGILTCAIEGSLRLQKFIPRALQNAEWLFIGAATVRGCRASANSSRIQCKLCCITAIRMKRHIAIGNAAVGTGMIMRASGDARVSASATRPSYSYYHSHRY